MAAVIVDFFGFVDFLDLLSFLGLWCFFGRTFQSIDPWLKIRGAALFHQILDILRRRFERL